MNLLVLLASALFVHVPIDDATELRLVAAGTGDRAVDWYVDGDWVATTGDGEAAHLLVDGACDVWATTAHEGNWRVLVRPAAGSGPGDLAYVEGWSAHHDSRPTVGANPAPYLMMLGGLGVVAWRRFRPKRP